MAVYKVPQDVEADDKLIGPFSFRQFIYLLITAAGIAMAWGLSQVFLPLAVIPLPVILLFGALALPLRKDQPMEVYLAAVVSFHIKPRLRIWKPDGVTSLIEVTAPKTVERLRTKGFDENEAERRLSYLAGIVDSQGWAVRGVADQSVNSSMNSEVFMDAQQTEDVLDDSNTLSKNFDQMISQADANRREEMIKKMHDPATLASTQQLSSEQLPQANPFGGPINPDTGTSLDTSTIRFNPYPSSMHQTVIQPLAEQRQATQQQQAAPQQEMPPVQQAVQQTQQPAPTTPPTTYQIPVQPQAPQPQATPIAQPIAQATPPIQAYQPQQLPVAQPAYQPEPDSTLTLGEDDDASNEQYIDQLYADATPAPAPQPQPAPQPAPKPVPEPISPDTIDLAINHHDLSVETIQREANRLKQKQQEQSLDEEEVVISLH